MTDDDLRDKLARFLAFFDHPSTQWHDLDVLDLASYLMRADALMSVVREALAQAWDEGAEAAYEWQIGVTGKPDNPWREAD